MKQIRRQADANNRPYSMFHLSEGEKNRRILIPAIRRLYYFFRVKMLS